VMPAASRVDRSSFHLSTKPTISMRGWMAISALTRSLLLYAPLVWTSASPREKIDCGCAWAPGLLGFDRWCSLSQGDTPNGASWYQPHGRLPMVST
jgi:hypothetical protein